MLVQVKKGIRHLVTGDSLPYHIPDQSFVQIMESPAVLLRLQIPCKCDLIVILGDFLNAVNDLRLCAGLQQIMLNTTFHGPLGIFKFSVSGEDHKLRT